METKSLLFGLGGFILGGLVVSVAATTLQKAAPASAEMTMTEMTDSLKGKSGDDFDKAFITGMIEHHQGAIDMAKLAKANAKHDEIKKMSDEIVSAQSKEIEMMRTWQGDWDYENLPSHKMMSH